MKICRESIRAMIHARLGADGWSTSLCAGALDGEVNLAYDPIRRGAALPGSHGVTASLRDEEFLARSARVPVCGFAIADKAIGTGELEVPCEAVGICPCFDIRRA